MSGLRPVHRPVVVVGGGISGIACASAVQAAGLPVVVYDRGRVPGGRMAVRDVCAGHVADIGASYFVVPDGDEPFAAVVADWERRGLARRWTDTFHVAEGERITGRKSGPMRWAGTRGLRALVQDLARGLVVESAVEVEDVGVEGAGAGAGGASAAGPHADGIPARAVVLAMPGPQAADLLGEDSGEALVAASEAEWTPCLALCAGWDEREWPEVDGVFVNGSPVLDWLADDGRRRGDGAPVLVAHSTPGLAERHLDDPDAALPELLAAVQALLGIRHAPGWSFVRRWSLAKPVSAREEPFLLTPQGIGLCGDGWNAPARVSGAWGSGRALGEELVRRLT